MSGLISTAKTASGVGGAHTLNALRGTIADNPAAAIGHGDPVVYDATTGHLVLCPETRVPDGILRGIEFINAQGQYTQLDWCPAGTVNTGLIDGIGDIVASVEPVADRWFRVRATGTVARADIGDIKRLAGGSVNTNTGRSGATVDMAASVTTEVRLVRIRDLDNRPGNAFGSNPFLIVEFVDPDASSL